MKIRIADATASQLASYASLVLGIPADGRKGARALAALIEEAAPGIEEIELADEAGKATATPTSRVGRPRMAEIDPEADVVINISRSQQPGEDAFVPVAVNGVAMLIPRGKEVVVKQKHVEVLRHAVEAIPEKDDQDQIIGWQEQPKYPFSIVGYL